MSFTRRFVNIDDELWEAISETAEAVSCTKQELVNQALRAWVEAGGCDGDVRNVPVVRDHAQGQSQPTDRPVSPKPAPRSQRRVAQDDPGRLVRRMGDAPDPQDAESHGGSEQPVTKADLERVVERVAPGTVKHLDVTASPDPTRGKATIETVQQQPSIDSGVDPLLGF
jgi:hypothetical protein